MIRVLVVDDSETFRAQMTRILESDPQISVVGWASTGQQALAVIPGTKPDLVTMDALMPDMDGVEATKRILRSHRVPIIVVSAVASGHYGVRALGAGALDAIAKPTGAADRDRFRSQLLKAVKLFSEVPMVLRRDDDDVSASQTLVRCATTPRGNIQLVAIGASTGGPGIIASLLQSLPPTFRAPIVVAQHVSRGFDRYMIDWWSQAAGRQVELAESRSALAPGKVVVAPANRHLVVTSTRELELERPEKTDLYVPSIDRLFHSIASIFGSAAVGLLLSGMGDDGAAGLLAMCSAGATTAVQEPSSAVVGSMPNHALMIGGASAVLRPEEMATWVGAITTPPQMD